MPIHDWGRVKAGIFHDFHHALVEQIKRDLNAGILPTGYYAMAEQIAAGLGPDVLALHTPRIAPHEPADGGARTSGGGTRVTLLAPPKAHIIAETDQEHYRRKQSLVSVRHVSDHRVVAVVEVVSPGNKSTRSALDQFTRKAAEFLNRGIHLLVIDLIPPGRFDPNGIHGAIWDYIASEDYLPPAEKPLTAVAYESELVTRGYVEPLAVGDAMPEMPLFLEPGGCVSVPLERSYQSTWDTLPPPLKELIQGRV
jgi:Protein of unknown function (DUF4058)